MVGLFSAIILANTFLSNHLMAQSLTNIPCRTGGWTATITQGGSQLRAQRRAQNPSPSCHKASRPACSSPLLFVHSHFDIGHGLDRARPGSAETSELGSLQASAAPGSWLLQYRQKETSSNTMICWVGKMHKDSLPSGGKRELWAFQRRAADLLQLEAFPSPGLRPLATL